MEMPRTELDERLAQAAVVLRKLRRATRMLAEFGEQLLRSRVRDDAPRSG